MPWQKQWLALGLKLDWVPLLGLVSQVGQKYHLHAMGQCTSSVQNGYIKYKLANETQKQSSKQSFNT